MNSGDYLFYIYDTVKELMPYKCKQGEHFLKLNLILGILDLQ
jgi:hypothetical protein